MKIKTKQSFLSGRTTTSLKIKHTDGDRWHQFALLSVKGEANHQCRVGLHLHGLLGTISRYECVSSPLFFVGGWSQTVYQPLRYKCAALH